MFCNRIFIDYDFRKGSFMKVLFIGGTGTISMAVSRKLLAEGHTLYLINRGNRNTDLTGNLIELKADINDEAAVVCGTIVLPHK